MMYQDYQIEIRITNRPAIFWSRITIWNCKIQV